MFSGEFGVRKNQKRVCFYRGCWFLAGFSVFSGSAYSEQQQGNANLKLANELSWVSSDNYTQFDQEISINDFVRLLIHKRPDQFGRDFFFRRYSGRNAHNVMNYCYNNISNEFDRERCYAADVEADKIVDAYLSGIALDKTKKYPTKIGGFYYLAYSNYKFNEKIACFTQDFSKNASVIDNKASLFNIAYNTQLVPGRTWQYGFSELITLDKIFPDLYNSSNAHVKRLFHKWSLFDKDLMPFGGYISGYVPNNQICFDIDPNTAEQISKNKSDDLYIKYQVSFNPLDAAVGSPSVSQQNGKLFSWNSSGLQKECLYRNDNAISCREKIYRGK